MLTGGTSESLNKVKVGGTLTANPLTTLAAEGLIIANGGKTYFPYGSIGIVDDALNVYEKVFREYE
jgi:hypothetical protein